MRRTLCCLVFVPVMMALTFGCGNGSRPVGKVLTAEEVQAAREKDAQEMLKMKNRPKPPQAPAQ